MGRELRKVPSTWEHPKDEYGQYIPLLGRSFGADLASWHKGKEMWEKGFHRSFFSGDPAWVGIPEEYRGISFAEWDGDEPQEADYMPDWNPLSCPFFMMYEDTSEGTPISPKFATPEALARWLADNEVSAFADMTATYDQWLTTINRGWALSAVYTPETGQLVPGTNM